MHGHEYVSTKETIIQVYSTQRRGTLIIDLLHMAPGKLARENKANVYDSALLTVK